VTTKATKMENDSLGKADLHIHSTYSYDGISTPEEIVKHAAKIGLNVIAITDHDEIVGGLEAQKFEKKYKIDIIVGEEVLTNEGEVIALFIKNKIKAGLPLFETVKLIKEQGGLVIIPHPFAFLPMFKPAVGVKNLYSLFKDNKFKPDGIEIMNSTPAGKMSYKKNKRLNDSVFCLSEVGGSDAHIKDHVGMGVTLFEGKTKDDLKNAILASTTTVDGEFLTRRESLAFVKGNIVKRVKKTRDLVISKPINKIKNKFNTYLRSL